MERGGSTARDFVSSRDLEREWELVDGSVTGVNCSVE